MARGSAVIPYHGKRGTVWRIKYADADGRQVMETLGLERDGWTRTKAQRALGAREAEVARGMRKPPKRTFGDLLDQFVEVTLPGRGIKKSTLADYKSIVRNHLRPEVGNQDLTALSRSPELFDRYIAQKVEDSLFRRRRSVTTSRSSV
jgi:Phage integrase, N-terminal SAM-like domain